MSLFTSLLFSAVVSAPILQEGIEVRVGSHIIATSEIDELAERLLLQNPSEGKNQIRTQARKQLIERAAVEEYLNRYQMDATDRDITSRINLMMSSNGMKSQEDFRQAIEAQFGTFERFREDLRWQLNKARFHDLAARNVSTSPSESDLKEYFTKNKSQFEKTNFKISVAECLIPRGLDASVSEKLAKTYEANPKTFESCVKNKSISPSKDRGGELGEFAPGSLPPDLEAKLFALRAGQTTVIQNQSGFQVLKVLSKKSLGPIDFESVKERIRGLLLDELASAAAEKLLTSISADLTILPNAVPVQNQAPSKKAS